MSTFSFPKRPMGHRGRKIPDDGRSSLSDAIDSNSQKCPRGFRHERIADACGDALRTVTPENSLLRLPPSCYLAEIAGLRLWWEAADHRASDQS